MTAGYNRSEAGAHDKRLTPRSGAKSGISLSAIIFCLICTIAAVAFLAVAAVVWVAGMLGSLPLACVIFGVAAGIGALVIYLVPVRRTMRTIHGYAESVYETSQLAKAGLERVRSWFGRFVG